MLNLELRYDTVFRNMKFFMVFSGLEEGIVLGVKERFLEEKLGWIDLNFLDCNLF